MHSKRSLPSSIQGQCQVIIGLYLYVGLVCGEDQHPPSLSPLSHSRGAAAVDDRLMT